MSDWKKLRKTQSKFCGMIARLLLLAESIGEEPTLGDAYRDERVHGEYGEKGSYSHPRSTHKVRLACDINLLDEVNHERLHSFWDILGGSERIPEDMGHYSIEWEGIR